MGDADLGDYEVLGELGRGGMGRVLRVRHRKTGAVRALKMIAGFVDPDALERLRREGEALARLGGDGVVPVHEAGVDRGRAFLVLGLMAGGSLRERLRAREQLDWREASALIATVARALERCHAAGLVHRDLKPDNILFDDAGRPRLADFGCVRDLGAKTLTATGETLGTLTYMAPEQVDGTRPTPKVDVYALGVVLFELVAGRLPFDASGSPARLLREKLVPSRPRPRLVGAPAALDGLVDRALAADPADRPDAAGLAAELDALLAGSGPRAARWGRRPSGRVAGAAIVVAVVAVLGLLARWASAWNPAPRVPGPPAPTKVVGPPGHVTPPAPPAPPPKTIQEAIQLLQTTRPVSEAAAIASLALAATPPPDEVDRAALQRLALERLAHEVRDREAPTARELRAACGEALHALTIALAAGAHLGLDALLKLERLLKGLNRAEGATNLIDDDLLRLLAHVVPRLRSIEVAHASGDLCETGDWPPRRAPRLTESALEAAIAVVDDADLRFVRGRLLAHRVVHEGRADLIASALDDLARARDPRDLGISKNQAVLSLGIAARLHAAEGRYSEGLALLDRPRPPVLQEVGITSARVLLALERGRLELHLGHGKRASAALMEAATAAGPRESAFAEQVEQVAGQARVMTDPAELQALAGTLPEHF